MLQVAVPSVYGPHLPDAPKCCSVHLSDAPNSSVIPSKFLVLPSIVPSTYLPLCSSFHLPDTTKCRAKPCYVCYGGTPILLDLCVETKSLWAYSVIKILNIFTDMLNITELHPFIHLIKYFVIYHSEKMRYVCYILFFHFPLFFTSNIFSGKVRI